jgi:hypothetical protein
VGGKRAGGAHDTGVQERSRTKREAKLERELKRVLSDKDSEYIDVYL